MDNINVAVVGCGYWGPNLIRNFNQIPNCTMKTCCDLDEEKLDWMKRLYPGIETTTHFESIIQDSSIDAVVISTPVYTHYELAKQCLSHNKHVLVEKPLASSSVQCVDLIKLAEENNRVLMVGHTFEYTAAVNKIKELIKNGELGEIYYVSCTRVNLGLFQPDINVIWDLAPHDLSILLYVFGEPPVTINAHGKAHIKKGIEDVATLTLNFSNNIMSFLQVSWLHPDKIRNITIVGDKKMLVYNDISPNEKIKIFDKGVEVPPYYDSFTDFYLSYRYGDIFIPRLNETEPLRTECEHFLDSIKNETRPRSDGYSGLRVVSILEAANRSLRNNGIQESIKYGQPINTIEKKIYESSIHFG